MKPTQALHVLVRGVPAQIAKAAKQGHAAIMDEHKPSDFVRRVDGKRGAPEEVVRADGVIIYNYTYLRDIVEFALATLRELSPDLSGLYRKSHQLFIAGQPAANADTALAGEEVMIANLQPYSRKIELGRMNMRVPGTEAVYERAASIIKRRYGNQVDIRTTFRALTGAKENRVPVLIIRPI